MISFKEYYIIREGWLDKLQLALDVIGFEPTVGTVADASNAVISALRSAAAIARRDGDTAKQQYQQLVQSLLHRGLAVIYLTNLL
jgi:hypothetical protein